MDKCGLKKAARALLPSLSWPLAVAERALRRGRGVRVLMYHRVADLPGDRLSVRPDAFARQMDYLVSAGWRVVPLSAARERDDPADPRPRAAITFDDGFFDFFSSAWPVLHERGFPSAVFVVPGLIEGTVDLPRYRGRGGDHRPMDWKTLLELRRSGALIGSHGITHRELTALSDSEAEREIIESRRIISGKLGVPPAWFAYPRGQNSPRHRLMVARAGYAGAVTVAPGACRPSFDPFALPRTEISADDDDDAFRLKLSGAFDPWHWLWQKTPWF